MSSGIRIVAAVAGVAFVVTAIGMVLAVILILSTITAAGAALA